MDTDVVARVASILVHEIPCDQNRATCVDCPARLSNGGCLVAVVCDHLVELYRWIYGTDPNC